MLSRYRRHGLIIALALLAGLGTVALRPAAKQPVMPSIRTLLAGSGWQTLTTYAAGGWRGEVYQPWLLGDNRGARANLFLGVATEVQKMVHWSGELGYEGAGYQILKRGRDTINLLAQGKDVEVSDVVVQHGTDREVLQYATVSPDGIIARSTDDLLHTILYTLRGDRGPWYLVRVSVPVTAGEVAARDTASRLTAALLSRLSRGSF